MEATMYKRNIENLLFAMFEVNLRKEKARLKLMMNNSMDVNKIEKSIKRKSLAAVGITTLPSFITFDNLFFVNHLHEFGHKLGYDISNNLTTSEFITPCYGEIVETAFAKNISNLLAGNIEKVQINLPFFPAVVGVTQRFGCVVDNERIINNLDEIMKAYANEHFINLVGGLSGPLLHAVASGALLAAGCKIDKFKHPFFKNLFLFNAGFSSLTLFGYSISDYKGLDLSIVIDGRNVVLKGDFIHMADEAKEVLNYGGTGNVFGDTLAQILSYDGVSTLAFAIPSALIAGYSFYKYYKSSKLGKNEILKDEDKKFLKVYLANIGYKPKKTLASRLKIKDPYEIAAGKMLKLIYEFAEFNFEKSYIPYEKNDSFKQLYLDRIAEYLEPKFKGNSKKIASYIAHSMPSPLYLEEILIGLDRNSCISYTM